MKWLSFRKKRTMNERNGSLREIKKHSFDRSGKYDYAFTEWTNFAKDLKKSRFLRNEQFLNKFLKNESFLLIYEKTIVLFYWANDFTDWKVSRNNRSVRKRTIYMENELVLWEGAKSNNWKKRTKWKKFEHDRLYWRLFSVIRISFIETKKLCI